MFLINLIYGLNSYEKKTFRICIQLLKYHNIPDISCQCLRELNARPCRAHVVRDRKKFPRPVNGFTLIHRCQEFVLVAIVMAATFAVVASTTNEPTKNLCNVTISCNLLNIDTRPHVVL